MAEHHSFDNDLINHLIEIVHRNLRNEAFSAGDLASAIGMSQRKLSRKIKSLLNKSVSQFIRETRLLKAAEMLKDTDITAAEVAFKVGFGSATYFNKSFHEFFGYPPGKLKKGDVALPASINPDLYSGNVSHSRTFLEKAKGPLKVLSVFTAILLLGYYLISGKSSALNSAARADSPEISVAVLPFKNLADSAVNQYFIDGLRDEILTNLSKIHSLRIISILAQDVLHGNNISVSALGRKLHVDYLVTGSGQKYKDSFELRVQMIETKNGRQKWADSFTSNIRETNDIFMLQDQIALSIVTNLKAAITPEERELIEKSPTLNLKSWDLYQRGMYELAKSPFIKYNDEAVKKGDEYFRQALKYDSTLAEAYIGRAWVYLSRAEINEYSARYLDSLLILANIALSYNDKLSDAYYTRGFYYFFSNDTKKAIKEYEKALLYNPNSWYVYQALGFCMDDIVKRLEMELKAVSLNHDTDLPMYLKDLGRMFYGAGFPEKGDFYFREALNLDKDSLSLSDNLIEAEACTRGEYSKAIQYNKRKYLTDSTDASTLLNLGYYSVMNGNYSEALKYYNMYLLHRKECAINLTYERQIKEPYMGYALLKNGYTKEADYYFDNLLKGTDKGNQPRPWMTDNYTLAGIYALKGNTSMAYKYLEQFTRKNNGYLSMCLTRLANDPFFYNLRNESRFRNIVLELEARYKSDYEKVKEWLKEHEEI